MMACKGDSKTTIRQESTEEDYRHVTHRSSQESSVWPLYASTLAASIAGWHRGFNSALAGVIVFVH
jgi:hypothetical protein